MVIISAYHKTGSTLIFRLFRAYQDRHPEFEYRRVWSFFNVPDRKVRKFRCAVMIRHPWEVIMSGSRYHAITNEKYFNRPRDELGGRSYREHVSTLNESDRVLFEIENTGGDTIESMYRDRTQRNFNGNVYFLQLESLWDRSAVPAVCQDLADHLQTDIDVEDLTDVFLETLKIGFNRTHAEDRHTFEESFEAVHWEAIRRRFPPDLLEVLGYAG